jgi:streptogramin lyase
LLEVLENRLALSFSLGTTSLVEGPASGTSSDIVTGSGALTAQANNAWLHTNSSGSGNGLATFTFDANPGATRSGTLTIAGHILTVIQAGNNYEAANLVTLVSSGLSRPTGVAVDGAGNVYIADAGHDAIKKWNASTQTVTTLVSEDSKELGFPRGVAVDGAGNVYIANQVNIKVWNASTKKVSTLVPGLLYAIGVAVDGAGNVYIANFGAGTIDEWNARTRKVTTLISEQDLQVDPWSVAVDGSGNVYITSSNFGKIREWNASTKTVTTLVSTESPNGVAVDGSGNVYFSSYTRASGPKQFATQKWHASTERVSLLNTGLGLSTDAVAVDRSGNLFFANEDKNTITELSRAFVSVTPFKEKAEAGSDMLLPVLPTTTSLTGVFAPVSDQPWLTVDSTSNGVIHFSFTQNAGTPRTANLIVLGQKIAVIQVGAKG